MSEEEGNNEIVMSPVESESKSQILHPSTLDIGEPGITEGTVSDNHLGDNDTDPSYIDYRSDPDVSITLSRGLDAPRNLQKPTLPNS